LLDDTEEEDERGPTRKEGEAYLSTPCVVARGGFNVLGWWKANEGSYPHLSQVAKDILAVQIAQVGVESVFNLARDVIGDRRHRLHSQTIRKIMIMKHLISDEQILDTTLRDTPEEESQLPSDEQNDLFELAADTYSADNDETPVRVDSSENEAEVETPSRRERRPRKRKMPARYTDR